MDLRKLTCLAALCCLSAAAQQGTPQVPPEDIVLRYSFQGRSSHGWLPDFADYTLDTGDLQRVAELRKLPKRGRQQRGGYYLQGMNRSDDLFMYLKRPLGHEEGILPGAAYRVGITVELLSNAPSHCAGAGGAPGEGVYLKAGVMDTEPVPLLVGTSVRINIDKGEQSTGGANMALAGNIANGKECVSGDAEYVMLTRSVELPEPVRATADGRLWAAVGTDSAYEGFTGLYYSSVTITLRPIVPLELP